MRLSSVCPPGDVCCFGTLRWRAVTKDGGGIVREARYRLELKGVRVTRYTMGERCEGDKV